MEAIHQAAWDGDATAIDRLVADDGGRLNARNQVDLGIDKCDFRQCTPLMLAAYRGHDAAEARLLALGADTGLQSVRGTSAAHWTCIGQQSSALALLLDTGAAMDARNNYGTAPLIMAAGWGANDCVMLLVARGGPALDLDAKQNNGSTALHLAAFNRHPHVVSLLVHAGADPTIRNNQDRDPLERAQAKDHLDCAALIDSALAEPRRSRALFKACVLHDAAAAIRKTDHDSHSKGMHHKEFHGAMSAVPPLYLKARVAWLREPPRVTVNEDGQASEELVACIKYALGLEGGGGVVLFEGQEPSVGMLPDIFVELLDHAQVGPGAEGRGAGGGSVDGS